MYILLVLIIYVILRPGLHPPKCVVFVLGKKFLLAQGVQLFVAVPTVPRGALWGAYHRTYLHLHARYRGLVGGVRAVFAVLSQLLGAAKKNHLGGYGPGCMTWSHFHAPCILHS